MSETTGINKEQTAGKERRTRTVFAQIYPPIIVFVTLLIVASSVLMFAYNMVHYLGERFEAADMLGRTVLSELESYQSLGFLIPYWEEHSAEIELFYGDDERLKAKELELREELPGYTEAWLVTRKEAEELSAEGRLLFAEICYYELCRRFDFYKSGYDVLYLYSFVVRGDEIHYMVTGTVEGEKHESAGGGIFDVGAVTPYVEGWYPVLDAILKSGEAEDNLELSLMPGADRTVLHIFEPVFVDGELSMLVGISFQWRDVLVSTLTFSVAGAIVAAILFIIAGLGLVRLIKRVVVKPLQDEQKIILAYEEGKDTETAIEGLKQVRPGNEIEDLAVNFSSMLKELDRYMDEVQRAAAEQERISAELDLAKRIQASMLPSAFPAFPERHEFDLYASMTPAKEVGGDFYDFYLIDDDHLGLVMADVSGKGVPAAMFMAISKALLKTRALSGGDPASVLGAVNEQICDNEDNEMFVTVWLGILTISTGALISANGGHEYPALRRSGDDFVLVKSKHGPPLGVLGGVAYTNEETVLNSGDILFLYTDGVPEANDRDGRMYGEERMLAALNERKDCEPRELLVGMKESVDDFVGERDPFDDLTMLAVSVK